VFLTYQRKTGIYYALTIPSLIIMTTFAFLYFDFSDIESISYLLDRVSSAGDSGRFQVIFLAVDSLLIEHNPFIFLFGHGLKSFQLLSLKYPTDIIVETSNNLYVDVLFECGVLGLLLLIFFLGALYKRIIKISDNRMKMFGVLIFFDILISSLFRADYATFRFFFLLLLLNIIIYEHQYPKTSAIRIRR